METNEGLYYCTVLIMPCAYYNINTFIQCDTNNAMRRIDIVVTIILCEKYVHKPSEDVILLFRI